jgi:hypothetical protein
MQPTTAHARVFHLSETDGISAFSPRISEQGSAVVWAIDDTHVPNYLLPRDCPRVCVRDRGMPHKTPYARSLLSGAQHVIYVEKLWRKRIENAVLFRYAFDAADFVCVDENAGYFHAKKTVIPMHVDRIDNALTALEARAVSLRFVDALAPIAELATHSGLQFSCIRMRNAQQR